MTSHRPNFKWSLGPNSDGVHVELCSDPACANVVASFDASTTAGGPVADLSPGTLYWRAFGRNGSKLGLTPSPIWELTVGQLSAPVNTSWTAAADYNRDGFADFVMGDSVTAYIYFGNATGVPGAPVSLAAPAAGGSFAGLVSQAGDVNGDGYTDLLAYWLPQGESNSRVLLYYGGTSGLATVPAVTLTSPQGPSQSFGSGMAPAGDFNGDGYADVVIGPYVFFGSNSGLATNASTSSSLSGTVASAGDVNGDGLGDVIAGDDSPNDRTGRAVIIFGSVASPGANLLPLEGPDGPGSEFGRSVANAGDVNGDGYSDVLIGEDFYNNVGRAFIYFGSADGPVSPAGVRLDGPDGMLNLFGYGGSGLGDANGDGYDDFVVGTDQTGRVYVYHGGTGTIGPAPNSTPSRPDPNAFFGVPLTWGDFNGDGLGDLLVGGDAGYLYLGSSIGLPNNVSTTLTPPVGASQTFGTALALRLPAYHHSR